MLQFNDVEKEIVVNELRFSTYHMFTNLTMQSSTKLPDNVESVSVI